jgi:hypothetical protein
MIGEQARIRNAVRRIDAAEKWLVDNAFEPSKESGERGIWLKVRRTKRYEREDAIEALIQACRDYLRRR